MSVLCANDIMDGLQVSIAWLLLKMTFDPVTAQLLPKPRCPTCREGYFVKKNCSVITTSNEVKTEGVQCQLCTDCSAADQDTLVKCSTFADSLCGDKSSPAVTPTLTATEPPELFLSSCFCCSVCFSSCWSAGTADAPSREVTSSKVTGPAHQMSRPLPSRDRPLPSDNGPLPSCDAVSCVFHRSGSPVTDVDLIELKPV